MGTNALQRRKHGSEGAAAGSAATIHRPVELHAAHLGMTSCTYILSTLFRVFITRMAHCQSKPTTYLPIYHGRPAASKQVRDLIQSTEMGPLRTKCLTIGRELWWTKPKED